MEKELVLLVGVQFVGKTKYMQENYYRKPYQIVYYDAVQAAMNKSGIQTQHLPVFLTAFANSVMAQGLPVLVNGVNISLEALHIWKKMCFDYGYKLKLIMFDADKEKIFKELEKQNALTDANKEAMEKNIEMYEELKTVLNLKHQKIADEIEYAKLEENANEVL